jgi:hypothetical protein
MAQDWDSMAAYLARPKEVEVVEPRLDGRYGDEGPPELTPAKPSH